MQSCKWTTAVEQSDLVSSAQRPTGFIGVVEVKVFKKIKYGT